jgi:hypothetical protein
MAALAESQQEPPECFEEWFAQYEQAFQSNAAANKDKNDRGVLMTAAAATAGP